MVTHSWNAAFQLRRICFALTLEGCPNFMPIFMKAFLWTPNIKSSLYWKHSALGAWPQGPAWSLCTAWQGLGVCWSRCAGSQTLGTSSNPELSLNSLRTTRNAAPLHLPPKVSTMAGFISSQEAEVPLFDSPFLWYPNLGRAMNVVLLVYVP